MKLVGEIFRFYVLFLVKMLRFASYPTKLEWVGKPPQDWSNIRLIFILNHTSLFEFIYAGVVPISYLWRMAKKLTYPVAAKTFKKPIAGTVLKYLAPNAISITRKRDDSWKQFLDKIEDDSILLAMPEGRMKRSNGLDMYGKPMTVRGGALELLEKCKGSKALLVYSGGLFHVLGPNDSFPRLFKKIRLRLEVVDIDEYLCRFKAKEAEEKKWLVAKDLEKKRDLHCPSGDRMDSTQTRTQEAF